MQHFYRLFYVNLLLAVFLLCSVKASAQTDIKIGTGTTSNTDWVYPSPLANGRQATRMQFLYLASELHAAGMTGGLIEAARFKVLDLGMYYDNPLSAMANVVIKMGTTTAGSLGTTGWESATSVVYTAGSYLPVMGVNSFAFTTPYLWNGTDNIVVEMCMEQPEPMTITANRLVEWTTGLPFNGSRTSGADWQGSVCNVAATGEIGTQTNRPNITFSWRAVAACTAAGLNAGTAITNIPSLCVGEEFKVGVTGNTVAIGLTYQWQSSPNDVDWTNIPKATQDIQQPLTQTASTWYRAVVTCATGGVANSASVRVLTPTPVSGTYTINNKIPASGTNFRSFNDAYNAIRCGINGPVVFNVTAGGDPYTESLLLKKIPGSSATNTITFNGNGNTLEYTGTGSKDRAVIKLDGGDYFVFNDLTITSGAGSVYGYGVQLTNDADTNVIHNCIITIDPAATTDNFAGITVGSGGTPSTQADAFCDGNVFSNNTINGGSYGIIVVGSGVTPNAGTKIQNNRILDFYETGIYLACSFNSIIDSNYISRPVKTASAGEANGIYVTGTNTRLTVSKNTITNMFGGIGSSTGSTFYGINFSDAPARSGLESVVSNNLIYNINGGGNVYGLNNAASTSVHYFYNTISLDGAGTGTTAAHVARGFNLTDAVGVRFNNNNISITRAGQAANTALYYNVINTDNRSDRNNLYVAPGTGIRQLGYARDTSRPTLAAWIVGTGYDVNSMVEIPAFVNLATGNLRPTNAALNDAGTVVNITVDITGTTRATTPDIGAFEFTPPPCVAPPTPGKAILSANAICVELPVSLTLAGNSTGGAQTFQLESAPAFAGPFTAIGNAASHSTFSINATTTLYYRVKVTCSGNSAYSDTVLLTVYPPFTTGMYTINKNKPASATNFQSFSAAYSAMDCGIVGPVVFDVEAGSGTYVEQLIWKKVKGASAVNTITFRGHGDTLRYSATSTTQKAVIKLTGASFMNFENLVIDAAGTTYGFGVQLMANSDNNSFKKCVIRVGTTSTVATNSAGIVVNSSDANPIGGTNDDFSDCDFNVFEENTIIGGYYGVTMVGNVGPYPRFVNDNKLINNKILEFYARGIYLKGTGRAVIEGNTISRPTRTAVTAFYGIYAEELNGNLQIRKNRITNPFGGNPTSTQAFYGMYFINQYHIESEPNFIFNNLVYNVKSAGVQTGIYVSMTAFCNFYHNTISLDDATYTGTNGTNGILTGNELSNVTEFKNNIITIARGGNGLKYGFNFIAPLQWVNCDRNDYYIKGAGENNYIGYRDKPRATLQEWRDATGNKDAGSISENPVYADTAAGNLAPTVAPLDNTGLPVPLATADILNNTRSTTKPDIGAYEFTVPDCPGTISGGQAVANPNPASPGICMGTMIKLSLNNNTASGRQTYQWQNARAAAGPWQNVGDETYVEELTTELIYPFYRCKVTCSGTTVYSDPVQVNRNAPLAAGEYLIKKTGGDFPSFTAAVAAMQCGIDGAVTFNVAPDTYNEQVNINHIPGAMANSRVTFRSQNGDASGVQLTFLSTTNNYILKLNSADYITIKNISIIATSTASGRAIELAGNIAYDSISNNIITVPVTAATTAGRIAVFASPVKGTGIVINGNTITNGASGIYVAGSTTVSNKSISIIGNTLQGFYQYGVYVRYADTMKVNNNTFTIGTATNTTAYGLYADVINAAYQVTANNVTIANNARTVYGLYINNSIAKAKADGAIEANKITAITANTGTLTGLYVATSTNPHMINNVINIKNSGSESYGLYSAGNTGGWCYNNTVYSTATAGSTNIAAYFTDNYNATERVDIRNNIFAHAGGGLAITMDNKDRFNSDYNLLYTSGPVLIQGEWQQFDKLDDWKSYGDQELNSLVFKPEFASSSDLQPNAAAPGVWAINGRGVQILENDHDINGNKRAIALKEGVPDLGAYEFVPSSIPVACVAQPATPVAGGRQAFMLGSDTVSVITWGATVPSSVTVRRYSGAVPPALATGTDHMYFYVEAEVTGSNSNYALEQRYLDPWRGFVNQESRIRLGRTEAAGTWRTDLVSTVNTIDNNIAQSNLDYIGKFTGLTDAKVSYPSSDTTALMDSTNMGTRFWVGYGHSDQVSTFTLNMGGAAKDADVTVRINGTTWVKQYHIPANTFIASDPIPRNGVSGAYLSVEGKSDRAISIESTEPITAYARGDGGPFGPYTAGSTLLLPVSTYGYEYYALTAAQSTALGWVPNAHSWFFVIADHDSTVVEITPSNLTAGGRLPGQPFTVTLNRGEVYQVLGSTTSNDFGTDLSGSRIRTIGTNGKCYPVTVFSGNSDAQVDCRLDYTSLSGNYFIQQGYPVSAWGKRYLTAPASRLTNGVPPLGPDNFQKGMYRIMVKDPATVVKVNGTALSNLTHNFYEYWSKTADYIESDKPVMVAQYLPSLSLACTDELGGEGPEIFYLVPIEQGIKKAVFYRSDESNIGTDVYLTMVVPTAGLSSLRIDGSATFDHSYVHPNRAGYTVVVKRWPSEKGTSVVQSDTTFTGIVYGIHGMTSYGYTLGSLTPNLARPAFTNIYDSTGNTSAFTCVGTPFKNSVLLPLQPTRIIWRFSSVSNMTPAADSIQDNPVPTATVLINGSTYYKYEVKNNFVFSAAGDYAIPVEYTDAAIENCTNTMQKLMLVKVVASPVANFNISYSGCLNDAAQLIATVTAENGDVVDKYKWNFGDATTSRETAPSKQYAAAGTYTITLDALTKAGCIVTVTKPVTVKNVAVVTFVSNVVSGCPDSDVTLAIKDPQTGVTYNWYEALTGGTAVHTGTSLVVSKINATKKYYVDAVLNGCGSRPRQEITAVLYPVTATPVVSVDSIAIDLVRFKWNAVPGVTAYQVSTDGGNTWITPSSGTAGLTHTITGLQGGKEVKLRVKAVDPNGCVDGISADVITHTLPAEVFIPNAFTPNGDNKNDVFKVEGYVIRSMQLMIFNQWGAKVFETADQAEGWDGRYKGQSQPSGVYIYVCNMILQDGSRLVKKGAVNLVR